MAFCAAALLFLAVTGFQAEAAGMSPVQKILSMIDKMVAESQDRLDAAVKDYKDFANFCDKTSRDKDYSLKSGAKAMTSLDATIEISQAKIGDHRSTIADLSTKIAAANGELYKAASLRKKDHTEFVAVDGELTDAVDTLDAVRKMQERGGAAALTQLSTQAKQKIQVVEAGLKSVIEAGFVTQAQRSKVTAFLEARADANDGLSGSENGNSDTLKQVMDMAEDTLTGTRKTETVDKHEFTTEEVHFNDEIGSMNRELAAAQQGEKIATQALAEAQKQLALEKNGHHQDTEYVADLKLDCSMRSREWESDYRETTAELKAVNAAKAILVQKFQASLLETHAMLHSTVHAVARSAGDDGKARALRAIQVLGKRLHSTALVSLAYRAAASPFSKIQQMIQQMLEKLQHEAAEEATHEAFCNEEQAKTSESKDLKQQRMDKTDARIESAESSVAVLSEEIATLSQDVAELDAASAEATALRTSEKATFTKGSRELSDSVDACNSAIDVLQQYYEGAAAALLQAKTQTRAISSSTIAAAGAEGILSALRGAESDFAQQLSESRVAEEQAAKKYALFAQDSAQDKAVTEAEIKAKESEVKSLRVALSNYGEDREGVGAELEAVTAYLAELKPRCAAEEPESYSAKKQRREQELDGLREALKMLEE